MNNVNKNEYSKIKMIREYIKDLSYENPQNINENNYPRCEGCEDDNIDCCDEQGADHDNFKGPNYIFSRNPDMVT